MPAPVPAAGQPAATPFARTKDDNAQVIAMFKPFAARPEIAALQTEVLADPGLTIETIQARLLAEMGKGAEPANPQNAFPKIETVSDEGDKRKDAVVASILARAGVVQDAAARAGSGQCAYPSDLDSRWACATSRPSPSKTRAAPPPMWQALTTT